MRKVSFPSSTHSRGFTLVEVLVALFVVAVALPALLSQVMGQVDGAAILREKMLAHWVAENRLTQLRLQKSVTQTLFKGKDSGTETLAGVEWQWQVVSSETELSGLYRYDITVSNSEKEPLAVLVGFVDD